MKGIPGLPGMKGHRGFAGSDGSRGIYMNLNRLCSFEWNLIRMKFILGDKGDQGGKFNENALNLSSSEWQKIVTM